MGKAILDSMAVITEAFAQIDISEDEMLAISSKIDFVHIFDNIPDLRMKGKVTYRLADILFLVFWVKLSKRTNCFMEIAVHIKINRRLYERYGLIKDGQCPSHDTIRRVMMSLDADALYEETVNRFYEFLLSLEDEIRKSGTYRHLAMDGKSVNGSGRADDTKSPKANQHVFNVYDCGLFTCIHSEPIDKKTNEIPVGQHILEKMNLKKTVVTADAMHCQKKTASIIHNKKGVYVLTVKDNQPLLLEEICARFNKTPEKVHRHEREKRIVDILLLPKGYATDGFTGMKAFVQMTSSAGKSVCKRCFITNTINEELICEAIEGRWMIENDLHKEKDTFLYEDRIRFTDKNAVHNMAVMNNLAIQLVRIYQAVAEPNLYTAKLTVYDLPVESIQRILAVMNSAEIIRMVKSELRAKKKPTR
ncbi:MAG: ISAs1 family transposase [Clostridiales Family XIII bacterium]|jgi:predicted transposase YbfD/YdcC|nr:ISAs1 family transposase [Clostridiales Family XIII bacterium]